MEHHESNSRNMPLGAEALQTVAPHQSVDTKGAFPATEKFIPVFFVDPVPLGATFVSGEWPLHLTLFPPLEGRYTTLESTRVRAAAHPHEPFDSTLADGAYDEGFLYQDPFVWFGSENTVPVRRIEDSPRLRALHRALVGALARLPHDPTYRMPYNPHISLTVNSRLHKGDCIHIDGFSIVGKVDTFAAHDAVEAPQKHWEVIDKIRLKIHDGQAPEGVPSDMQREIHAPGQSGAHNG